VKNGMVALRVSQGDTHLHCSMVCLCGNHTRGSTE
jgi:hypothetical protein